MNDLKKLQAVIGYSFNDTVILSHALTHSSYANEMRKGKLGSNERLEFLGDAVLELVSSEYFFQLYPSCPEGELTKMRAGYVCEAALYNCAEKIPLSKFVLLGKGEEQSGGRNRPSLISDAFEALIGAIYLDGELEAARAFIHKFVLEDSINESYFYDSKTILQEEIQKNCGSEPVYEIIDEEGPDHLKSFTVAVKIDNQIMGVGKAASKKHAAQKAAYEALKKLGRV